jgi:hypothetical protein
MLVRENQTDEAIACLKLVLEQAPDNQESLLLLGVGDSQCMRTLGASPRARVRARVRIGSWQGLVASPAVTAALEAAQCLRLY